MLERKIKPKTKEEIIFKNYCEKLEKGYPLWEYKWNEKNKSYEIIDENIKNKLIKKYKEKLKEMKNQIIDLKYYYLLN